MRGMRRGQRPEAERREELRDDQRLARRCCEGDTEARRELVRRHVDQVRLTLFRIVGPSQDLPDLVQTSFLELLRSLGSYRGDALLRTWVDRVCANVAYQHLRRRRRPEPVPMEVVPEPERDGDPEAATGERRLQGRRLLRSLAGLMEALSPEKRVALVLHAVQGYSVAEVAVMTGANESTVKSRIMYGRRELLRRARRDPELRDWLAEEVE